MDKEYKGYKIEGVGKGKQIIMYIQTFAKAAVYV